jgi:hypothetical protein
MSRCDECFATAPPSEAEVLMRARRQAGSEVT